MNVNVTVNVNGTMKPMYLAVSRSKKRLFLFFSYNQFWKNDLTETYTKFGICNIYKKNVFHNSDFAALKIALSLFIIKISQKY